MASKSALKTPIIGSWHKELYGDQSFEIIAIDESGGNIEIQYLDGNLAEFDFDSWSQLELSPAAPPEDASAGYEMMREDQWGADTPPPIGSMNSFIDNIDSESFIGTDEY